MAVDDELADRVRDVLGPRPGLTEKRMFSSLAFLINGNICCGVRGEELLVRLGPDQGAAALTQPGVRSFGVGARAMKGWVLVSPEATATADALIDWVHRSLRFAETLPPGGTAARRT